MKKISSQKNIYLFFGLVFGLIFGIFLAISLIAVNAALDPPVSNGETLTASLWNNMRGEVGINTSNINSNTTAISSLFNVPCSWIGERGIYGGIDGCEDDVYITCTGGEVTNMRMGC